MKSSLRDKFRTNSLVKPLYRKLKHVNKLQPKVIAVNSTYKLDGQEFAVKRKIINVTGKIANLKDKDNNTVLPGASDFNKTKSISPLRVNLRRYYTKASDVSNNMFDAKQNKGGNSDIEFKNDNNKKQVVIDKRAEDPKQMQIWLRFYPLPKLPDESVYSVFIRCIACQLGLASILVLWTVIMTFVVQNVEGPYEKDVSRNFEIAQDQLVIDLATELRQITPLSPRWKEAIFKRIKEERMLTLEAVSKGARIHPGLFWDLSGTFLFIIYVMTALGFGAPVPQTIWGRTSALIYAILAVPIHLYLLMNASMCIVTNLELYITKLKIKLQDKPFIGVRSVGKDTESPNVSRNSDLLKVGPTRNWLVRKIMRLLGVLGACRCVPLAIISYYIIGVVAFGVLRERAPLEVVMFPLEFTTTGGLNGVAAHVRIMYAFYIEGAMWLIACTLATLRRHSSTVANHLAVKYRLYATEN